MAIYPMLSTIPLTIENDLYIFGSFSNGKSLFELLLLCTILGIFVSILSSCIPIHKCGSSAYLNISTSLSANSVGVSEFMNPFLFCSNKFSQFIPFRAAYEYFFGNI